MCMQRHRFIDVAILSEETKFDWYKAQRSRDFTVL